MTSEQFLSDQIYDRSYWKVQIWVCIGCDVIYKKQDVI